MLLSTQVSTFTGFRIHPIPPRAIRVGAAKAGSAVARGVSASG